MGRGRTGRTHGVYSGGFPFLGGLIKPGLSPATKHLLAPVVAARGLHNVDELLVQLGKKDTGITHAQAFDLLEKELGADVAVDANMSYFYSPGKGYERCNFLLDIFMKAAKEHEKDHYLVRGTRDELKKYCGYTDDELKL